MGMGMRRRRDAVGWADGCRQASEAASDGGVSGGCWTSADATCAPSPVAWRRDTQPTCSANRSHDASASLDPRRRQHHVSPINPHSRMNGKTLERRREREGRSFTCG